MAHLSTRLAPAPTQTLCPQLNSAFLLWWTLSSGSRAEWSFSERLSCLSSGAKPQLELSFKMQSQGVGEARAGSDWPAHGCPASQGASLPGGSGHKAVPQSLSTGRSVEARTAVCTDGQVCVRTDSTSKGLLDQSPLPGDGREHWRREGPLPKQVLAKQL